MNTTNKIDIDEAFNTLRQWYWGFVKSRCAVFLDGCLDLMKHGEEPDRDDAEANLHSLLDDSCIYNKDNAIILAASDNDGAYVDNYGSEGIVDEDGRMRFDRLAHAALEADMMDTLGRTGFDMEDIAGTTQAAIDWLKQ